MSPEHIIFPLLGVLCLMLLSIFGTFISPFLELSIDIYCSISIYTHSVGIILKKKSRNELPGKKYISNFIQELLNWSDRRKQILLQREWFDFIICNFFQLCSFFYYLFLFSPFSHPREKECIKLFSDISFACFFWSFFSFPCLQMLSLLGSSSDVILVCL